MRALLYPFFFLLFTQSFAQTRDLVALAQGEFLGMNALFDENDNLFGYISLYDYGKSGAKTKKFEYVILDKNLNPFANNTFQGDITAGDYFGYIHFDGSIVLSPTRIDASLVKQSELFSPSAMVINLKDNTIKRKIYYDFDHGTFKEIERHDLWTENRKEFKAEKKQNGFNYISDVNEIKEGGFLAHEYDDYGRYVKNNRLMRFDENKKELWRYEYNQNGTKKESQIINFLEKDEKYYYCLLWDRKKKADIGDYGMPTVWAHTFHLLVLDMQTGKEVHKKEIADPENVLPMIMRYPTYGYGMLDNDMTFDDKIVVVGRLSDELYNTGICRLLIDRKTFSTDLKILTFKDDFKVHIPKINAKGFVETGYFLDPRDIFFMKDGSIGMLFEKYKPPTEYTAQKTTDLVYVYTDKNFKIAGVTVLEKEKSRWLNTDYLFSQNINDGNDLVFFYRDYQKDDESKNRNWNLFINTLINGKFKQEMIPMSSKENFFIYPYIAKEGYILLHEFNKKAKYNQIRLERLNY